CRSKGLVKNPDQYENKLLVDFRLLQEKYKISLYTKELPYPNDKVEKFKNLLFQQKKKKNKTIRYTKTAAKVDATNILFVRSIRGNNNYNYSDVKSFYLTTDRTLNKILAREDENVLSETIL